MPNATRPSGSIGTVSSFDLEPNPFEQSFASTKKDLEAGETNEGRSASASASASVSGGVGNGNGNSGAGNEEREDVRRSSSLNYMGDVPGGNTNRGSINGPGQGDPQMADQRRPSPLLFGNQRNSSIQSPPILTPGGSKKLPPLLMSPTYLHNQQGNGQMQSMPGTQTPLGGATQPGNETDSQLPGFLMNLFKSGLTPNESNLRANFTPGILANLPAMGGNGIGLSRANSNANILPNNGERSVEGASSKLNGQIDMTNKALTALGGLPAGQLTPGLSSLLAGAGPPLNNQTPGGMNGKSNSIPTNSYFPVPDNKKSNSVSEAVSDPSNQEKALPKKRGRKKGVTNKETESKKVKTTKGPVVKTEVGATSPKTVNSNKGHTDTGNMSYANMEGGDDQNLSLAEQERRRQEFLERNRVAASRFRRKKKEYIKKIEADLNFYQQEYEEMSKVIGSLAGITPEGYEEKIQGSMLLMAEQALMNNDMKTAMQILERVKQIIASSGFVKRNGSNPRLDSKTSQDSD